MNTSIFIALMMSLMLVTKSVNPVKTSVAILITGVIMLMQMGSETGAMWIPILMVMLFMGGIIMMFMILSSVLPNEKSMKVNGFWGLIIPLSLFLMSWKWMESNNMGGEGYKSFLISGKNFWMMMTLILWYFIVSMSTLSSEENPMRALYCYRSLTL